MKKRILALILGTVLLFTSIPFGAADDAEPEQDPAFSFDAESMPEGSEDTESMPEGSGGFDPYFEEILPETEEPSEEPEGSDPYFEEEFPEEPEGSDPYDEEILPEAEEPSEEPEAVLPPVESDEPEVAIDIPEEPCDASGTCGDDLTWTFTESTGTLTISGTGSMKTYSSANAFPWKNYRSKITNLVIGNDVTTVTAYAFWQFSNMTSLTVPASLNIHVDAFWYCTAVTSLHITVGNGKWHTNPSTMTREDYVKYLPWYRSRAVLTAITIDSGITYIPAYTFMECAALTSITIPNTVTTIKDAAFRNCSGLRSITMPCSATLEVDTFSGCTSVTSVRLTSGTGTWSTSNYSYAPWYICNATVTSITFDYGIKEIGDCAFINCTALTSITIPESVTRIGIFAFSNCKKVKTIQIPCSTSVNGGAFQSCSSVDTVRITKGTGTWSTSNYKNAPWYENRSKVTTVILNNGIRTIGANAFTDCTGLTSITIPASVTSIGSAAFSGCSKLTAITIPNNVTIIGDSAFSGCTGITDVTMPCSATVEADAFADCAVASVQVTAGTGYWSNGNYENTPWYVHRTEPLTVTLNEGIQRIGASAFCDCVGLSEITIPESVTYIDDSAFCGCTGLTSFTIPDGVTYIGNNVFAGCSGLEEFIVAEENQQYCAVDGVLFTKNMTELVAYPAAAADTSYEIPSDVITIDAAAFFGCEVLTDIVLPGSAKTVGESAFSGCTALSDVYYQGTKQMRGKISIESDNTELQDATWHYLASVVSITIKSLPNKLNYHVNDALDVTGGEISVMYDIDVTETETITPEMVTGYDPSTVGTQTLTVTFESASDTYDVTVYLHFSADPVQENIVPATCTEDGHYDEVVYCSVCHEELSREVKPIPAFGHDWGDPYYTWATDNSSVTARRDCRNDANHFEAETATADATVALEPTCTEPGKTTYSATFVNPVFSDQTKTVANIPALGHTPGEPVIENEVEPTCTEEGGYDTVVYCTVCGEELSRVHTVIPALGHTPGEPVIENEVEATCTEDGGYDTVVYCTVCGEELSREHTVIPARGHTPGEPVQENIVEPTYTREGRCDEVVYCTVCHAELSRKIVTLDKLPLSASVEWNAEDVQFKGTTAYVIANGRAQRPRFTVKNNADGSVISSNYYNYEYRENTNAGTGYVIITFKNGYTGTCRASFKIYLPATTQTTVENTANGIRLTWQPVTGAAGYVIYRRAWSTTTGGWTAFARWDNTTETTYLDGHDASHQVYAGTRYQYGVKAYFARRTDPVTGAAIGGNVNNDSGNFNLGIVGPLKTTVRITTRKLKSVKGGAGQATVQWEPSSNFTGYEIQVSTNADFSETTGTTKTFQVPDAKVSSGIASDLDASLIGKAYYFRVRSYHVFEKMTYYGGWSNVLSATCYPKYRALLVGECSYSSEPLVGCLYDMYSMQGMVSDLYHTKYVTMGYYDLTKAEILEKIRSLAKNSFDESVTLFYYSGHGLSSSDESKVGALYAIDGNYITFKQLAAELSKIKGRVIVILDSCFSGASIKSAGGSTEDSLDTFNGEAIEAFSGYGLDGSRDSANMGELKQSKFIVITASAYNHASYAAGKPGYDGGGYAQSAFTAAIIKGMGRKYPVGAKINRYGNKEPADKNSDGKITLWEIYSYANSTARSWTGKNGDPQRAKYYGPEGEVLFW